MEQQYIVTVTQKKTCEVVVSAPNPEEAKRRGIEKVKEQEKDLVAA